MSGAQSVQIVDASGLTFSAWLRPTSADGDNAQVLLQLDDGTQFLIPRDLLENQGEGRYALNLNLREYARNPDTAESAQSETPRSAQDKTVIQLAEEKLRVGTRRVARAHVRVDKRVVTREETVDMPLLREEVAVECVAINRVVEQAEPVCYEGDTTIIPLYEEVRVTRRQTEYRDLQRFVLRREEVVIERDDLEPEGLT